MATEIALPAVIYAVGVLVSSCFAHENPHNSFPDLSEKIVHNPRHIDPHTNRLNDRNIGSERDHIMEHYDGILDKKESEMTDDQLHFHYFKVHDTDNNNMLDGLEIVNAMTHFHSDQQGEDSDSAKRYTDDELEEMIGKVLTESDVNNDGFVDYSEYVLTTKKDQ